MAKKNRKQIPINFKFSEKNLDYFIAYSLSENPMITINNLKKLRELINNLDIDNYNDDDELLARIFMLKIILKMKIKNINDESLIWDELLESKYSDFIEDITGNIIDEFIDEDETYDENNPEKHTPNLSKPNILYIDEMITDVLRFSFIFNASAVFNSLNSQIEGNDYESLHDICESYESVVTKLYSKFKKVKQLSEDSMTDFNSNDSSCVSAIKTTLTQLKANTNILRTSIKMKNEMLNGGYEAGRFYLVLGLQGRGKSRELLQIAMDIKHYNKESAVVEGKIGVVLFVTQENSIKDTLGRIWSYYTNDEKDFKDNTVEEAYDILCKYGFNKGVELAIKYRKSRSINTNDIDIMIDEIEQDGKKKVIAVIHDYLKRIRCINSVSGMDTYTELGNVSDEFCNIAKERNITVISAMQFNRTAMAKIQEALRKNKNDPLKLTGSSDISESIKIVDNADVVYSILDIRSDNTPNSMMQSYNLLKFRGNRGKNKDGDKNNIDYFVHPFVEGSTIKLAPDLNLAQSLSKLQSGDGLGMPNVKDLRKRNQEAKEAISNGGRAKNKVVKESNAEMVKKFIEEE